MMLVFHFFKVLVEMRRLVLGWLIDKLLRPALVKVLLLFQKIILFLSCWVFSVESGRSWVLLEGLKSVLLCEVWLGFVSVKVLF